MKHPKNHLPYYSLFLFLLFQSPIYCQDTIKALFLGNSYTYVNNLPEIIQLLAKSTNDTLIIDSQTPGGCTLKEHWNNPATLNILKSKAWNYLILQEQSQIPALQPEVVNSNFIHYGIKLDSLFKALHPEGTTLLYMTWGRENGDLEFCPQWPPVCTYSGMDDMLRERYRILADTLKAEISPAGAIWRYLRTHHPEINLYSTDGSHPSLAGSFATACSFYTALFRKAPTLTQYTGNLPENDVQIIQNAAKITVYDSLCLWNITRYDPISNFSFQVTQNNYVIFTNLCLNATHFFWDFGDGITSEDKNPVHQYSATGKYSVSVISSKGLHSDTLIKQINISPNGSDYPANQNTPLSIYPNPVANQLTIHNTYNQCVLLIYDIQGINIAKELLKPGINTYNVCHLKSGCYIIKVISNTDLIEHALIIKKIP